MLGGVAGLLTTTTSCFFINNKFARSHHHHRALAASASCTPAPALTSGNTFAERRPASALRSSNDTTSAPMTSTRNGYKTATFRANAASENPRSSACTAASA